MAFKRGEFAGFMVENAVDNQRQLAKFESNENDRCSRDLWREKSNTWALFPGAMIATGIVNACSLRNEGRYTYPPQKQRCPDWPKCPDRWPPDPHTPESRLQCCRTP